MLSFNKKLEIYFQLSSSQLLYFIYGIVIKVTTVIYAKPTPWVGATLANNNYVNCLLFITDA